MIRGRCEAGDRRAQFRFGGVRSLDIAAARSYLAAIPFLRLRRRIRACVGIVILKFS
jgi:hypothetical protein